MLNNIPRPIYSQNGPLFDENNMYTDLSKKMVGIRSKQDVFSVQKDQYIYSNSEPSVEHSLSDIDFTKQDIIDAIDELSNNSASGPDGVTSVLLKQCKDQLSKPLYILWRNFLNLGVTPEDLRTAHIIPIFKDIVINSARI